MDYPIKTPAQLGPVLAGIRKDRKLTQAKVGKKVGLAQNYVSVLENSSSTATLQQLFKLMSALNLDLVIRDNRHQSPNTDW